MIFPFFVLAAVDPDERSAVGWFNTFIDINYSRLQRYGDFSTPTITNMCHIAYHHRGIRYFPEHFPVTFHLISVQKRKKSNFSHISTWLHDYHCSSTVCWSRLDLLFTTSHTPVNTSTTATPCCQVKTPSPVSTLTVTATMGCT